MSPIEASKSNENDKYRSIHMHGLFLFTTYTVTKLYTTIQSARQVNPALMQMRKLLAKLGLRTGREDPVWPGCPQRLHNSTADQFYAVFDCRSEMMSHSQGAR